MGEYADMILDGTVDQYTGELIDGQSPGYPRSTTVTHKGKKPHACHKCQRRFRTEQGLNNHTRDVHGKDGAE